MRKTMNTRDVYFDTCVDTNPDIYMPKKFYNIKEAGKKSKESMR